VAKIAPSVLGADFSRLAEEIANADRAGADMFHLDIMDGHFVPNISFGPDIVRTINRYTDKFLDVHLMLSQPERHFEAFVEAGSDNITFHIEVHPDPTEIVEKLKGMGVKAGISLNPDTPVDKVLPYLEHFDFLLIMSVNPGFGGQEFIELTIPKITAARQFIDAHNLRTQIEVDGGVNGSNAERIVKAGANILVMGTAFFGSENQEQLVQRVKGLSTG
jgi:ribulose-phosphate 3-epimerase